MGRVSVYQRIFVQYGILMLIVSLVTIAAGTIFFGCTTDHSPTFVKNGKIYGKVQGAFRHRWWNYYERGLSFAEGEFYKEAVTDLNEALHQRSNDQRMARTYGMHFIDYFPNRELGIIYFQMGNLEDAKRELELSLSQFPSAKAYFYLDRVRKDLIEKKGQPVSSPNLFLDLDKDTIWTRNDPVVISGVAKDEHFISNIFINGAPLFLEGSKKKVHFKENLRLSQGRHNVEIKAENLPGKTTTLRIQIHVDREGPVITLEDLKPIQDEKGRFITASGFIYDEAGVSFLSANGQPISFQKGKEILFNKKIAVDKDELLLLARDRLGNETSAKISLQNDSKKTAQSMSSTIKPQRKMRIMLACVDTYPEGLLIAKFLGRKDKNPPVIKLKGWTERQTVFLEKIYLEGEVRDDHKIVDILVNQVPVLRREGKHIFFGHLADLIEGENTFSIEARDKSGNTTTLKILVIRQVPRALQIKERLSLTVMPFEQKGRVPETSLSFQDNLISALVDQNRFRIIERDKLDVILQEQKLSQTELIDRETALKLGRLIAAQTIITGSIIQTRIGIEIVARMIDTETSEILATEDVYDEVKDFSALRTLAEGMAVKFHREFPLLVGLVIQQKGNAIFTDMGMDKIKLQRRLIVYREEPIKHPITGKVLGSDNVIIGRARVTQVMPDLSKAEILDVKMDAIKRLDKVITE